MDFSKLTQAGQSCWPNFRLSGGLNMEDRHLLFIAISLCPKLTSNEQRVLQEIIRNQGSRKDCFPHQKTLQRKLGVNLRTVQRALVKARKIHLLASRRRLKTAKGKCARAGSLGTIYQVQPPVDVFRMDYLYAVIDSNYCFQDWATRQISIHASDF